MLSSYNITSQTVPVNGTLSFTTDRILTGCTATRNGQTFQLNKPGYYYVTFNASASTSGTAGIVTVQLNNGGQIVPGAVASFNSESTANTENVSFSTIIRVPPSCCAINNTANLTLVNTGVSAIYNNVNVNITKLC